MFWVCLKEEEKKYQLKVLVQKQHLHISLIFNVRRTNQILVFGFFGGKETVLKILNLPAWWFLLLPCKAAAWAENIFGALRTPKI